MSYERGTNVSMDVLRLLATEGIRAAINAGAPRNLCEKKMRADPQRQIQDPDRVAGPGSRPSFSIFKMK